MPRMFKAFLHWRQADDYRAHLMNLEPEVLRAILCLGQANNPPPLQLVFVLCGANDLYIPLILLHLFLATGGFQTRSSQSLGKFPPFSSFDPLHGWKFSIHER